MEWSLLNRTDLFAMGPFTQVEDHGDYAVLRTPTRPNFYDGNRLILGTPLTPETIPTWMAVFDQEFAGTAVRHRKLEWPGPAPDAAAWAAVLAAGYTLATTLCMALAAPPAPPPGRHPALEIRPLAEADRSAFARFMLDCHGEWGASFLDFTLENVYARQARLEGDWWLGWLDGRLAGSMGLFFSGPLGRFQLVDTHAAFRRRGVARTLITHLIGLGFARPPTVQLVMAADADYFAYQLYEQCGFRTVHRQYALFQPPPEG